MDFILYRLFQAAYLVFLSVWATTTIGSEICSKVTWQVAWIFVSLLSFAMFLGYVAGLHDDTGKGASKE